MIEYDAVTNRYTVTLKVGREVSLFSFDRDKFLSGEKEGLEYLIEGIQTSLDHALEFGGDV